MSNNLIQPIKTIISIMRIYLQIKLNSLKTMLITSIVISIFTIVVHIEIVSFKSILNYFLFTYFK